MANTQAAPHVSADTKDTRGYRLELVRALASEGSVRTPAVRDAFRTVPRHLFVPPALLSVAYDDRALPIGQGQTISQPTVVAVMTEALELGGTERVLEIGTGSGYQAAILSLLAREVFTMERVPDLAAAARERLRALGYRNVFVRVGDGFDGWPEAAPFDRVVITAASPTLPQTLVAQLVEGGIAVAPIGHPGYYGQQLRRYRKLGHELIAESLLSVVFVPMLPGVEGSDVA
jgi:protein-L-isoaspartate(D-aspartate) O-methyltransferase